MPIYVEEKHESFIAVADQLEADFCLKARGDSMTGARIFDGDIVIIRSQSTVENGEIAAVIIGDEATLKRVYYYPNEGKLILSPENPRYAPLVYVGHELESVKIIGKAVAFQSIVI
jgi:repressor LexA